MTQLFQTVDITDGMLDVSRLISTGIELRINITFNTPFLQNNNSGYGDFLKGNNLKIPDPGKEVKCVIVKSTYTAKIHNTLDIQTEQPDHYIAYFSKIVVVVRGLALMERDMHSSYN